MENQLSNRKANVVAVTIAKQPAMHLDDLELVDEPLLIGYDANDLRDREIAHLQYQEMRRGELVA